MKSTSGRSIEPRGGAVPREAPSGPSTSERLRLGPERPPAPGGPRRSPRRGGAPGSVPVRGGRHFRRRSTRGPGGCRLRRARLSSGFPELRCHSNSRLCGVFCKVEAGLRWAGTGLWREGAPHCCLPDRGACPQLPPGKGKKRRLEPGASSFHRPWEALPIQAGGTQGVFTPRLSSPLALRAPAGSSPQ